MTDDFTELCPSSAQITYSNSFDSMPLCDFGIPLGCIAAGLKDWDDAIPSWERKRRIPSTFDR